MFQDLHGIFSIVVIIGVFFFYFFLKKKEEKDWIYAVYFIVALLTGTALYSFALVHTNDTDTVFSPFFVIMKGLTFSLKSFLGDFSVSFLSDLAKENQFFHAAVIVHYFASVVLTFLIVIKLFGKNIINIIRVFRISWSKKYIVLGCKGQAGVFLDNLHRKQKRNTIVIIQPSQINKKNELIDEGYAVVIIKEEEKEKDGENIYGAFINALKISGAMRCKNNTKIVSMFEQDETNLTVAMIMTNYIDREVHPEKKDGRITLTDEQEKKLAAIKLDAYIMYSFLERAEHFSFIENALGRVRFFNPHKIRARKFLWENPITKLIPPNWIDTKTAMLKKRSNDEGNAYKISNIFIGFGSANEAILKSSIVNNQLLNVDYNALVISQDAKKKERLFRNSAVGLFDTMENGKVIKRGAEIKPNPEGTAYLESPSERNNILFREADALSIELYDIVIAEIVGRPVQNGNFAIPPCDYATVIIALGENKLSIETALELRQKLYEADLLLGKDGEPRVKIFVKISENTIHADEMILNGTADEKYRIEIFGSDDEVLTKEYIIDEKLDILARNTANRYEGNIEKETAANEWNICSQFHRESNRYAAMAIKIKLNLLGFDLIEGDKPDCDYNDFYMAYGIKTAIDLRTERKKLKEAIELARKDEQKNGKVIPENILTLRVKDEIVDLAERDGKGFANTPRNNLAMLEHQRWNAFYLANDWTKFPKEKIGAGRDGRQDMIAKQHACITTFNGLIKLRELQKNMEKAKIHEDKRKQYIEAESLLNADTIRNDFNTMDFLPCVLAGSGFYIGEFEVTNDK
jgi:uncharacterized protein (DUF4415 family)